MRITVSCMKDSRIEESTEHTGIFSLEKSVKKNMRLDRKEYEKIARQAVAEGIVMLKNEKKVLPLEEGCKLAVFGRMQNHYYKSGTGSGGMVNAPVVWGILDALKEEKVELNEKLLAEYAKFEEDHPFDPGVGFGNEPWSQEEMPVSEELVLEAAKESDIALVIIGRTAGEEQDYKDVPGAYKLAETELDMLKKVRAKFNKLVLLMNVSAVLDMSEIEKVSPNAILYVWQGGEIGGLGTADVLMGRISPSGKLVDSIVRNIEDAPAYPYFGNTEFNNYSEDIYVGYRYYETFDRDAVMYPFGFGLSYTNFDISVEKIEAVSHEKSQSADGCEDKADIYKCFAGDEAFRGAIKITSEVKNVGEVAGKEVVQVYVSCAQGELGKPSLVLAGFAKTQLLEPGASERVEIVIEPYTFASYDDDGITDYPYSYVLEKGEYGIYVGDSVRNIAKVDSATIAETVVLKTLSQQVAPIKEFGRIRPEVPTDRELLLVDEEESLPPLYAMDFEMVPTAQYNDLERAKADKPECAEYTGDRGIKLVDVRDGKASMEDFIAQLSDEDLSAIIRGEGMGSPKVTSGTAAAFGGVSPSLKAFGIPCGCCSDGPSGMRLDCGTRAFSLPSGTMLACTWNLDINKELFRYLGMEMTKNHVDVLLGPGINIHRHPLNGRNFEYFSEDPYVTGKMAAAQISGLKASGVSGTLKHFCANNQETNRHGVDSVVSERALREIYLKGYEIAIKEGGADSVMTTYGAVNGSWTNGRHDLNTAILREEWGFKGIVMTDWWAKIGDKGGKVSTTDFARLVLAQNDFYAVCPDAGVNSTGDNTLEELKAGNITRGQLARCASNICEFLMNTHAMERFVGEEIDLECIGFDDDESEIDPSTITYYEIGDGTVIDLSEVDTTKGNNYVIGVDCPNRGGYYMELTGGSELSELAQIPVAVFFQSVAGGTFTFKGTAGEWMTISRKILLSSRYGVLRLYFGGNGLKLKDVKFIFEKEMDKVDWANISEYIYG
ncbi:MAG: glycoside hydrolase family 3 C-terminal domain-containing protein [Lachnospiraceae bacterium]|nr:glycoside hydrolase family 3 C-terminal domain-containing protein [Lachnospiraceae bacterium]